jgi:DnaJ-class molecular chaperone
MNTIKEAWTSYARDVLPPDCPAIQLVETRRAFYAGAVGLIGILNDNSAGIQNDEDGVAMLVKIQAELFEFADGEVATGIGATKSCERCGGTGRLLRNNAYPCQPCGGSGRVPK